MLGAGRVGYFPRMFDGFIDERIDVGEVQLRVRYAGQGQPVCSYTGSAHRVDVAPGCSAAPGERGGELGRRVRVGISTSTGRPWDLKAPRLRPTLSTGRRTGPPSPRPGHVATAQLASVSRMTIAPTTMAFQVAVESALP